MMLGDVIAGRSPLAGRRMLTVADHEEISRGIAPGEEQKRIAAWIGRAPSMVCREIARHGGWECYRAGAAMAQARRFRCRPKAALAAWIAKEELRFLLPLARQQPPRSQVSNRLFAFYDWYARADVPEVTTLATTVEAWWPQILVFIDTGITNARTEATNRMVKDAARIAFGFRNLDNQRRRIRLYCKKTIINQPVRG